MKPKIVGLTAAFCFAKIEGMNVYGHITAYTDLPTARCAVVNMEAGQENPSGWLGFYQERGESVSAVGYHYETRNVLECDWQWRCQPMPKRLPDYPEPWILCGWTWLCEWYRRNVKIADTFAYSGRYMNIEMVNSYSQYNCDFGSFDILELRSYGGGASMFNVCRYWGFATKIDDNLYRI